MLSDLLPFSCLKHAYNSEEILQSLQTNKNYFVETFIEFESIYIHKP